jgi:predicted pyridoxine 5'-phosphate oxidase superfamily flavin-nucleotide-binding protein
LKRSPFQQWRGLIGANSADRQPWQSFRKVSILDTVEPDRPLPPWHPGEIAIQRSVGVADRMADVGRRVIRDHLIDQHREFYPLLPFVVLGAVDPAGNAWATLRGGRKGFMRAISPHRLNIRLPRDPDDPADAGQEDGDAVALLGIDLATRRRNRLNGMIGRSASGGSSPLRAIPMSFRRSPPFFWRSSTSVRAR